MNTQPATAFTQALESAHLDALNELKAQMTDPAASRAERRLAAAAILRIRPPAPKESPELARERAELRRDTSKLLSAAEHIATMPFAPTHPPASKAPSAPSLPGRSAVPSTTAALAATAGSPPSSAHPPSRTHAPAQLRSY